MKKRLVEFSHSGDHEGHYPLRCDTVFTGRSLQMFGGTYCFIYQSRRVQLFAFFMLITCLAYSLSVCHITDNGSLQEKVSLFY
jgi:hypothetical protein